FSSFAIGQNDQAKPPLIAVKIPLEGSIFLKGVSIKFLEVLEDSRCPDGVSCVWAGRAIVKVEINSNGQTIEKTIIYGKTKPEEDGNTNLFNSRELTINGLTLNPYPNVENLGEDTNYQLLVYEEKNQ